MLLAVGFAVLFVGVGAVPGEWGLPFGVTMAAFVVYWTFRDEVERHLTGPQEWGLFALASSVVLLSVVVETGELTGEAVSGFVGAVGVAVLFGYRAVRRR